MNNMKYKANRLRDGIRLALALPLLGVLAITDAQAAINLLIRPFKV